MTSRADAPGELAEAFDAPAREARLDERCAALVDAALRQGADEAEAYATRAETIAVRFEKGDLKLAQVDEGTTLGLRVFRAGRLGFCSTNQLDPGALERAAADARTLSELSVPDESNGLPAPRPVAPRPSLVHPASAAVDVEAAVAAAARMVASVRARDPRLSIDNGSLEVRRVTRVLRSSAGARAAESDARLHAGLFGMAVDGEDVGGFEALGEALRDPAGLEAALESLAQRFADAALGNLGARATRSYRGPVLFAPRAFYSVFLAPLLAAASAVAVQRGRSALAGKVGAAIAPPALSLADDPTDARLAGARGFDREGQPTGRHAVLEGGVLAGYLYDGYAARVEGRASTGHATGSARSVPSVGCHAPSVAPGPDGDAAALARALGRGLYVQRFSGTVSPASGDFSGVAKSARWIEDGAPVGALKETLVSGNAFELLANVGALSGELESLSGSALAPWAIVDGVSVTGG